MGNSSTKKCDISQKFSNHVTRERHHFFSQSSLANIASNLSGRSFASVVSQQSNYSVSRPWSRISRRRWKESTLTHPYEASKTAWPVANIEASFLPEFPLNADLTERSFRVIEQISQGAYGKVYKVEKIDTKQIYALKILSKSQVVRENAVRQVKEEVAIQQICGHNPFIVNCPFHWQSRRRLYIISEFVGGGELHQLLNDYGILPEKLVQIFAAEIASVLDFLHNAGIIYRDLKPENILLDQDGHIQLIDFGLSKWLKYGDRTNTVCGTFRYMAPEVANFVPYGHAADWWSLGVLICFMLTNEYPIAAVPKLSTESECSLGVSENPPGTLSDSCREKLSTPAQSLLLRLLEREPRQRIRSLLTIQQQAFFKDFNFADIRSRKIKPLTVLQQYFPDGPPKIDQITAQIENFDFRSD